MSKYDPFKELFEAYTGDDGKEYRCVKCKYPMERIVVKTLQVIHENCSTASEKNAVGLGQLP